METWRALEKNALQKELNLLKVMEGRYKREELSNKINNTDLPNKYIDSEFNYMKEIRKAYFLPKESELKQVDSYYENLAERQRRQNMSPFEITDSHTKLADKVDKLSE